MKNCFLIVNYNDYKSTKHLVDNIIDYKIIDKILIVDNASNEEEVKLLKHITNEKIEIIYNEDNVGYSGAINIGTKYLIDKYENCNFIISNSDIVIFSEDDIISLIDLLYYDSVGIVGPQIIERGKTLRGFKKLKLRNDLIMNLKKNKNKYLYNKLSYDNDYYEGETSIVDTISTCFFLITSDTLKKINYMDENILIYYDDSILSQKITDLDLIVLVNNKVKVKHLYSITVNKVMKNKEKLKIYKESQLYYHINYNNSSKFKIFLLKITQLFLKTNR